MKQKVTININSDTFKKFQTVKLAKGYSISGIVESYMLQEIKTFEQDFITDNARLQQSIKLAKALYESGRGINSILELFKDCHNVIDMKIIKIHLTE